MLIPDDKGSLLPLAGERGDGEDLAGVPVDEVEALHLARVPKIVGHRLVHAQRGYSQTTCYTENQVFCFELFTVAHLFGFHPNTWISNTWFSSPPFGGFFYIFSLFTRRT